MVGSCSTCRLPKPRTTPCTSSTSWHEPPARRSARDPPPVAPGAASRGAPTQIRLRKLTFLVALVGLPAWALYRSVPAGGDIVNRGGLTLLDDIAASALHPSLDPAFLRIVLDASVTTLALALLGTLGALAIGLAGGLVLADVDLGRPTAAGRCRIAPAGAAGFVRRPPVGPRTGVGAAVRECAGIRSAGRRTGPRAAVRRPDGAGVRRDVRRGRPGPAARSARCRVPGRVPAVAYGLLPSTAPLLLSYSFYRFECALRSAVVLGVAGVGGLGFEVTVSLQSRNWDEVWTLVGALLLLVRTGGALEQPSAHRHGGRPGVPTGPQAVSRLVTGSPEEACGVRRSGRCRPAPARGVAACWWVGLAPSRAGLGPHPRRYRPPGSPTCGHPRCPSTAGGR